MQLNKTVDNPSGRNSVSSGWHDDQAIGALERAVPQVAHFFGTEPEGAAWFHTHNGVIELLNLLEDQGFAVVRKTGTVS